MKFKRFISILLVFAMLTLCACGSSDNDDDNNQQTEQIKYTTPAGTVKKSETVYVNLDSKGNVIQTIVSDWIHTNRPQVYVDDITSLTEVQNIKDDSKPYLMDGQKLRWYMNSTDLYYQGATNAKLPIQFKITYALDGRQVTPDSLIGKSGHVEITIKTINTDSSTVKVNGKNMTMYNPMLVVGGVALPESKFQNISVKNGRTMSTGNSQYAVLSGFPGINESLGLTDLKTSDSSSNAYSFDDTYVISADVTNFELGNLMFTAIPIASLDIGLNDISTSMDDVRKNLSKLQSVQKSLQAIDADALLNTITSDPNKLNNLTGLVEQAASLYDQNKALINVLNKYTTPQNIQAIQALSDYVGTADFDGLEEALGVINSIFGDDVSAENIQNGMALLRQMSADLSDPEVKSAIQNLPQTVSTLSALQGAINENKDLINALKVLSESNVLASIDSALSGVEGSLAAGGLTSITNITGDADEITAKMTAWIELGKKYTIFTRKTENMSSSVMFVFKADSLKLSVKNETEADSELEESGGIGAFFKKFFD